MPHRLRAGLAAMATLGAVIGGCGGGERADHAGARPVVLSAPEPAPARPAEVPVSFPNPLLPPPTTAPRPPSSPPEGGAGRESVDVARVRGISAEGEPEPAPPAPEVWAGRPALHDDRIFLLGDSVLAATGPAYADTAAAQLEPLGWEVEMDAKEARPPSVGARVIESRRDDIGEVVVVLLGNNYNGDAEAFDRDVGAMVAALDGVPWIIFLTVQEFRADRREVNEVLARWADTGRVTVVDWNQVVSGTDGANGGDGLHLTGVGSDLLARFIADTVGPAPSRLAPRPDGPS